MTVMITRLDQDASDMRVAAARSADAKVARRLLALALVLEGHSRAEAAQSCGMDRQTLRDWVHRYNEHGIAGLSNQPHAGGSTPKLMPQEKQEVARWVRQGPDPAISLRPHSESARAEFCGFCSALLASPARMTLMRMSVQIDAVEKPGCG